MRSEIGVHTHEIDFYRRIKSPDPIEPSQAVNVTHHNSGQSNQHNSHRTRQYNQPNPTQFNRTKLILTRPKEDSKGKRRIEEEDGVPEELLAALNFAALEGSTPPWAAGGKNWDPENGGLAECHIQVRVDVRLSVVHRGAMRQGY